MQVADIQGHWRRDWLRAPGLEDRATCVNWMQCGAIYADIRIPRTRPETRGATSLADLSCGALLKLMRAEGFAGEISLSGDVCNWAREIDWHGERDIPDAGRLEWIADDKMIETGIAADYAEQWHRATDLGDGAMRLADTDRSAVLVTVGERFIFGMSPGAAPDRMTSAALIASLEAGQRDEAALAAHFDSLYVYGRWKNGSGIAIQATNPLMEKTAILHCRGKSVMVEHMTYDGRRQDLIFQPVRESASESAFVA